jgi:hypothetical protein
MCRPFPTCETVDVVMQRIAAEIGSAADDLAAVEAHVAAAVGGAVTAGGLVQLQSLDRLGQQLRTLEAFLSAAGSCRCGRIDIDRALDRVWLEGVRKRLGGGRAPEPAATEPELW